MAELLLAIIFRFIFPPILIILLTWYFRRRIPLKEDVEREIKEMENSLDDLSSEERESFLEKSGFYERFFASFYSFQEFLSLSNHQISKRIVKVKIAFRMNLKIWLPLFFSVVSTFTFFFFNIFREFQFFLIREAKYVLVDSWIAFALPIGFLSLTATAILEPFIGKDVVAKKLSKRYYSAMALDHLYKPFLAILLILGFIFIFFVFSSVFHYAKITEEGLIINSWLGFNEEFYSWDKVKKIYYEKERILKNGKTLSYEKEDPSDPPYYIIFMNDGSELKVGPYKNKEVLNSKREEMIKFIADRSGLIIEKKIYNSNTKEYIDFED